MNECINMIGGECISVSHMTIFIISIALICFFGGYYIRKLQQDATKCIKEKT